MKQLTLSECSKRKLDETYLVVYAIKNEINIKKGDYIEKSDVYTLIGIDIKGFRQFLNIYQDRVDFKNIFKDFTEIYNNSIHQKLVQKYLSNIENLYKYSVNIRILLFKHSANLEFYDKIRLAFNSNNNYVLDLDEIYDKLGNINDFFGFTSFKKREWTLLLNDLIQIYPKIDFI